MNDTIRQEAEDLRAQWLKGERLPEHIAQPEPGLYRTWFAAWNLGGMTYADYYHILIQLIEDPDDLHSLTPETEYHMWCQLGDETINFQET